MPSQSNDRGLAAVILAAGRSTRMKTDLPKVMHDICGRPMLAHVLAACREAGINTFYIVVGFGKEIIIDAFRDEPGIQFVEQLEQKGTGHAVSMCTEALDGFSGDVVVIAGDMPMIRSQTLRELVDGHRAAAAATSIATTFLDDPTSYGRIVRSAGGDFEKIVEDRDCTPEQRKINEVNPSYYCFDAESLFSALPRITPDNAKGEFYITDVLEIVLADGKTVRAATTVPAADAVGINSRVDLADVSKLMQQRIASGWMAAGVTIVDPATTWIDSRARIGAESLIKPFSYIEGNARIGRNCVVGPYAYVADGVVMEDNATLGPSSLNALAATAAAGRPINPLPKRSDRCLRRPPTPSSCTTEGKPC